MGTRYIVSPWADRCYGAVAVLSMLLYIAGLAALVWQAARRLLAGTWRGHAVTDWLASAGVPWAVSPTELYGLHAVLSAVPVGIALVAAGGLLAWANNVHFEGLRRRAPEK